MESSALLENSQNRQISKYRLLALPAELRLRIYEFVFGDEIEIFWHKSSRRPHVGYNSQGNTLTTLLLTCKKINHEATPVFYHQVTMTIRINPDSTTSMLSQYDLAFTQRVNRSLKSDLKLLKNLSLACRVENESSLTAVYSQLRSIAKALDENSSVEWIQIYIEPSETVTKNDIYRLKRDVKEEMEIARATHPKSKAKILFWSVLLLLKDDMLDGGYSEARLRVTDLDEQDGSS